MNQETEQQQLLQVGRSTCRQHSERICVSIRRESSAVLPSELLVMASIVACRSREGYRKGGPAGMAIKSIDDPVQHDVLAVCATFL